MKSDDWLLKYFAVGSLSYAASTYDVLLVHI